jgi:class 3 adenylate cyclase/tetratricopeptide (TPR) repeat protein
MDCPGCQAVNKTGRRFCAACGDALPIPCPYCGSVNSPGDQFCRECGQSVAPFRATTARFSSPRAYTPPHIAEKIYASKAALEGERKPLTVLFCDITNSTALAERLGPEAMHRLLSWFFELALAEVHRFEGTINQFLGDGFMALFGAPLTHEDHARRAALAALGIQRNLKERPPDLGHGKAATLAIRIGLNTGTVVVGTIGDNLRMDYTAVGDTTNLAARLQQIAEPGTICLSESTQSAIRRYFDFQRVGERAVKGKAEPVTVYRLLGPRATTRPGSSEDVISVGSPLVGRETERAALTGAVERVRSGRGGIVSVTAEAGLGKSRLVAEVRRQAIDPYVRWVEGRALSFSQTMSYLPFIEIVKACAGIDEDDGEDESWTKLEKEVTALFPDEVAEVLPYLATLLALDVKGDYESRIKYLDAQAIGHQIFRTSRRFFERFALERPLVLVFEDWHWADQSSAELLEHLLSLVEASALLICCVGRPDPDTPAARLRDVAGRKYADRYIAIELSPLGGIESVRLVQNLLAIDERSSRVHELVLKKAEGNPFFIEEVVRSLIAMRAVVREEATGRWRAAAPPEEISLPDTIHGVIMARIDRLDEDLKQVLKLAAVVGRSFFYRVLRTVADAERELDGHLAELQRVDLIRERRCIPELEYIFKHALVQEATYESILADRRRQLHHRVAECIESLFADRLEEFASLLAYHYVRAEDWQKAQEYLFKAGDQAAKVAADAEALAHYERAAAVYLRVFGERWDPLQRAVFERRMGEALFRRGEHRRASEYLRRALGYLGTSYPAGRWEIRVSIVWELVRQVRHRLMTRALARQPAGPTDPAAVERVRIFLDMNWILYFVDQELLLLNALTCLNFSEEAGVAVGVTSGAMPVGLLCDIIGLPKLASSYHRRAVTSAEQIQHPGAIGLAYLGLGLHEHYVGRWEKALEHYQQSAIAYRDAGDLRGWGATSLSIVQVCVDRGDLRRAIEEALQMIRISQDGADHEVEAWGLVCLGLSRFRAGELNEAVPALQSAAEMFRSIPDYPMLAWTCGCLGQTYLREGRLRDALTVLEESSQIIAQRGVRANQVAHCRNALAEGYLAVAERSEGSEHVDAIKKARRACRAALQQGKIFSGGLPAASRLRGRYEWLRGGHSAALAWWRRSVGVAEELGARYDLGLTCLEIGKRTGERPYLERAEAIFAQIGAKLDLAEAQSAIRVLAP